MCELTKEAYEADTHQPLKACMHDIRARQDKLIRDLDMQERILRELLNELRELNRSGA